MSSNLRTLPWILALGSMLAVSVVGAEPSLVRLASVSVPPSIDRVYDLRWQDGETVLLAAGKQGVVRLGLAAPQATTTVFPGLDTRQFARSLATSEHRVVGAGPVWTITTFDTREQRTRTRMSFADGDPRSESVFDVIHDVDLAGDRLVVLSTLRSANGAYAPGGEIAWIVPVDAMRPATPLRLSLDYDPAAELELGSRFNGAPRMGRCAASEVGTIRFLDDGSVLVAPGLEPDLYRVRSDGSLIPPIWSTAALGIDAGCPLTDEQASRWAADADHRRATFHNRHRLLDEILPLGLEHFGLITREVRAGTPSWTMLVIDVEQQEPIAELPLPIDSTSGRDHLRADRYGDHLAFLVAPFGGDTAVERPRVLVFEWRAPGTLSPLAESTASIHPPPTD